MLSQQHRIVRGDDYRQIVRSGKRINSSTCVLHISPTEPTAPARFGFIVTKAVGKAHTRNLIRRRYKALGLELVRAGLQGNDVIVRAHPASAECSFADLRDDLLDSVNRSGVLAQNGSAVAR